MSYFSAVSDSFGFSHSRPCRGDALADDGDERACRVGRLAAQDDQLRLLVRAPRDGGQRARSGRRDLVPVPRLDGQDR
jgi:hypothetical protein